LVVPPRKSPAAIRWQSCGNLGFAGGSSTAGRNFA
jgi:hypothetical protein